MATPTFVESIGAWRAAGLLTEQTGIQIQASDIDDLRAAQLLTPSGTFKRSYVYAVPDLAGLGARPDFADLIDRHRMLNCTAAAVRLEIRPRDFEYVVAAGWIVPAEYRWGKVPGYRKEIRFPIYRSCDVDAVLDVPGVDWDEVRAVKPRQPSPLREYAKRPPTRAQIIRWFCTRASHRFEAEVWAWWDNGADTWYIDWDPVDGKPTVADFTALLAEDPVAGQYAACIRFGSSAGKVVAWARNMLEPGAAVILDFETTDLDGLPVEVAVIDTQGRVLIDTLVNPGQPISAQAQGVHGISDADVADAPTWDQVWPLLADAIGDRVVLAYNAEFDHSVYLRACEATGIDPGPLGESGRWECLMLTRSTWMRAWRWPRLGGGHRALGDTQLALTVLREMTAPFKH